MACPLKNLLRVELSSQISADHNFQESRMLISTNKWNETARNLQGHGDEHNSISPTSDAGAGSSEHTTENRQLSGRYLVRILVENRVVQ